MRQVPREAKGARRWNLIYPEEIASGIKCALHGRPTGLLHSCSEPFCDECLREETRCRGCGEEIPEGERKFACGCA